MKETSKLLKVLQENGVKYNTYMCRIHRYGWDHLAAITHKPRQSFEYTIYDETKTPVARLWSYQSIADFLIDQGIDASRGSIAGLFFRATNHKIKIKSYTIVRSEAKRK